MKIQIIIASILLLVSCDNKSNMESPLITVVKLNSAESLLDFEEARKYIDVEKTYSESVTTNISADQIWKEFIEFNYSLGQDKKFTNAFKYHNYKIKENQSGDKGKVVFETLNDKAKIREIIYYLNILDGKWKVVGIEYIK